MRDVKYGFGGVVEVSIDEIVEEKHLLTKFEPSKSACILFNDQDC